MSCVLTLYQLMDSYVRDGCTNFFNKPNDNDSYIDSYGW